MGKTSSQVKARYNAKAYDDIKVRVYKGERDILRAVAEQRDQSVGQLVIRAINAYVGEQVLTPMEDQRYKGQS